MYKSISQSLFYEIKFIHVSSELMSSHQSEVKRLKKEKLGILTLKCVQKSKKVFYF